MALIYGTPIWMELYWQEVTRDVDGLKINRQELHLAVLVSPSAELSMVGIFSSKMYPYPQ